jgi:hypothetical protein
MLPFTTHGIVVGERELVIQAIKEKFASQGHKVARHLNGNTWDNRVVNLDWCNIYDALVHIDDWTTDWVCHVTEEEAKFVRDNIETFKAFLHLCTHYS